MDGEFTVSARPTIEVETIYGRMIAFESDFITEQLISFGAHTRPELAFFLSAVNDGDQVFDLGAHIGTFSLPIARKVGANGKILAVEAIEKHAAILKQNMELNGLLENIQIVTQALGPAGAKFAPVCSPGNSGATHLVKAEESSVGSIKTTSIDNLVTRYFGPTVIKLDIEGYEHQVLRDSQYVAQMNPTIYTEVCDELLQRNGTSAEAFIGFLVELGYLLFRNCGPRNGAHDLFLVREFFETRVDERWMDILAVHSRNERLLLRVREAAVSGN